MNKGRRKKGKSFVQTGKACWECGSEKHQRKDCPKYKAKKAKESADDDDKSESSLSRV